MQSIYYSTNNVKIRTIDSVIDSGSIFSGEILDYFSIFSRVVVPQKVLVLGGGLGEVIRELFLNNKEVQIDIIELNQDKIDIQKGIYNLYFSSLINHISYFKGDANQFRVLTEQKKYDLICIDIYEDKGYPDFLLDNEFWINVRESLTDNGVALFNSLGYPEHINTEVNPHLFFLNKISTLFGSTYYIKVRRSCAIIFSKLKELSFSDENVVDPEMLSEKDRLFMRFIKLQSKIINKYIPSNVSTDYTHEMFLKAFMNEEMLRKWSLMLKPFEKRIPRFNSDVSQYTSHLTQRIIKGDPLLLNTVRELVFKNHLSHALFPNVIGSFYSTKYDFNWYFEWIYENALLLFRGNIQMLIKTYIPQIFTLLSREPERYNHHLKNIEELMTLLEKEESDQ